MGKPIHQQQLRKLSKGEVIDKFIRRLLTNIAWDGEFDIKVMDQNHPDYEELLSHKQGQIIVGLDVPWSPDGRRKFIERVAEHIGMTLDLGPATEPLTRIPEVGSGKVYTRICRRTGWASKYGVGCDTTVYQAKLRDERGNWFTGVIDSNGDFQLEDGYFVLADQSSIAPRYRNHTPEHPIRNSQKIFDIK